MRALKVLVVVMGIAIIGGSVTLCVLIVKRLNGTAAASLSAGLTLDEPSGTAITGIAATGDRLAVQLHGGGPDRVLVIDPHAMAVTGHIMLGH